MNFSKLLPACLTLLLIASTTTYAQNSIEKSVQKSVQSLPDSLMMEKVTGEKVNLKNHVTTKGKVTVLIFWATWSKQTLEQLDNINNDYLNDWQDEYDIELIAVSMDDSRAKTKVKGVVETNGWEFDILCNPDNSAYQALGFNSIPYSLLLDASGNILYKHSGYTMGDEEDLETEIIKTSE